MLRGEVACPLLSTLGESGAAQRMLEGAFTVADVFPRAAPDLAAAVLEYLAQIGLLTAAMADGTRGVTDAGRMVLGRWGAFALLHSYEEMFRRLGPLLAGATAVPPVNRARNIAGSGQLHVRKFFPAAVDRLRAAGAVSLVDIGCGDGTWLAHAAVAHPLAALGLLDASALAVETAAAHLRDGGHAVAAEVTCDGLAVEAWGPAMAALPGQVVISLWFVLHEFSGARWSGWWTFSTVCTAACRARRCCWERW